MPRSKEERYGRERCYLVGMIQYDKAEERVKIYIFSRISKNLSKAYAPSSSGAFS